MDKNQIENEVIRIFAKGKIVINGKTVTVSFINGALQTIFDTIGFSNLIDECDKLSIGYLNGEYVVRFLFSGIDGVFKRR